MNEIAKIKQDVKLRQWTEMIQQRKVTPNCRAKCAGCGAMKFKCGVCVEEREA